MAESESAIATINTLILPRSLREQLLVHLLACAPNEGVGMLGVRTPVKREGMMEAEAAMFVAGHNIEQSPVHFTMDPRDVIAAFRRFRDQGLHLGAIVHSHLNGPATPSVSDVNEWNYPEALMLIASFANQPPVVRAWRVVQERELAVVQHVALRQGE